MGLPKQMFQMPHLLVMENNCQIILKSFNNCRSYGPVKFGRMHTPMLIHRAVIVTTISHSPQEGLTKIVQCTGKGRLQGNMEWCYSCPNIIEIILKKTFSTLQSTSHPIFLFLSISVISVLVRCQRGRSTRLWPDLT